MTTEEETTLSHHGILDLYRCSNTALLDDLEGLTRLFNQTARDLKCTIVNELFHRFTPQGVSGVVIIAESHLSVHTWPELGFAAVDLYTCGDPALIDKLPNILKVKLGAEHYDYKTFPRGFVDRPPDYREQPQLVLAPDGLSADRKWLTDAWADQILWTIQVRDIVLDMKSEYQRIQIVDTERLGRILILDGNIQMAEADEAGYHEMIVHTALCRAGAGNPAGGRRVLIIGGGDGGAAREALRHDDVSAVDLVDIDGDVLRAAREFLKRTWNHPDKDGPLEVDPRFHAHAEDGVEWLKKVGTADGPEPYDLIVVDASDPIGPGTVLYTPAFYQSVYDALREGGATCVQGGSFWYLKEVFQTVYHGLKSAFEVVKPMECFTAVYPGGVWNLQIATKGDDPEQVDERRARSLAGLEWYSPARHRACFGIPPNAWRVLEQKPPDLAEVERKVEALSDRH